MRFQTEEEYKKEIAREDAAMASTSSSYLRRDYAKYKKRLEKEMRACAMKYGNRKTVV